MFLLKYLPSLRGSLGVLCTGTGILLLIYALVANANSGLAIDVNFILLAASLIALGLALLRWSISIVTVLNKDLGVVTISHSNIFRTTLVQYGYDEIGRGFVLGTKSSIGDLFPRHFIDVAFTTGENLTITGTSYYDREQLSEAVEEANQYLRPTPIVIHDRVEEASTN